MSYRKTKTIALFPEDMSITKVPVGYNPPVACPDHKRDGKSVCFRVGWTLGLYEGVWVMIDPLDIATALPGVRPKVLSMECYGMQTIGLFTSVTNINNKVALVGDGSEIWRSNEITKANFDWAHNNPVINKMIDIYSKLDIQLAQTCHVSTGSYIAHVRDLLMAFEYWVDVPPELCEVKIDVKNKETGGAVSKAYVALMSGTTVVADGYTDGGTITFRNVDEGSYTIKIAVSGYRDFVYAIEVTPPSVWYTAYIVPIPKPPLPWWVIPLIAVGGIGTAGVVAYGVLKKPSPPVVVMR